MAHITSLRNGTIVNHFYGRETPEALFLPVCGTAPEDASVTVNGVEAERDGETFTAVVPVKEKITQIVMRSENSCGTVTHTVKVLYDKNSFPRYNFFIDDNSFFWTELIEKRPRSLFDEFYLAFLKKMHLSYGTKFTLNLFYRNDHHPGKVLLSAMPECYKSEFADNAHWLKLSWHAFSEFPDRPYQNAPAEAVAADFDRIREEVVRFAGEESFIPPVAAHWSMVRPDGLAELVKRGTRVMVSQFLNPQTSLEEKKSDSLLCDVNFFRNLRECLYLRERKMLFDFDSSLIFLRSDLICNYFTPQEICALMEKNHANCKKHEIVSLETHEQYTFPRYFHYLPDHRERIETAIRKAAELGYKPVFFAEGLLGNPVWEES